MNQPKHSLQLQPRPQQQQRRQHNRLDLRMSAEVRTARTAFTATTRDLSEGGAGLSAERPLTEGEEVTLGLFLVLDDVESDMPPLWVKARVVWSSETDDNRHAAGVRFEVITDEQRAWLRQILKEMGTKG
jgi:c-di-GMP-binding flagellar brake protein YcgR